MMKSLVALILLTFSYVAMGCSCPYVSSENAYMNAHAVFIAKSTGPSLPGEKASPSLH